MYCTDPLPVHAEDVRCRCRISFEFQAHTRGRHVRFISSPTRTGKLQRERGSSAHLDASRPSLRCRGRLHSRRWHQLRPINFLRDVPAVQCMWLVRLPRTMPQRRPIQPRAEASQPSVLCASVDARRGCCSRAVRNGSLPQPQPEQLSRPQARVRLVHAIGAVPAAVSERLMQNRRLAGCGAQRSRCLGAHPSAPAAEEAAVPLPSPGGGERAEAAERRA